MKSTRRRGPWVPTILSYNMTSRYSNRGLFLNSSETYKKVFKKRGVKQIAHYTYPVIPGIKLGDVLEIGMDSHVWKLGDKLHKLSSIYYGDPTYWWIIAWFNGKPTDSHYKIGDIVNIPSPLDRALEMANS